MRTKAGVWLALITVLATAGLVVVTSGDDGPVRPDPTNAPLVALGRMVYGEQCARCHGATLAGQADWQTRKPDGALPAPPHDAGGHSWHHPDSQLMAITRDGPAAFAPPGYKSDMPAYGGVLNEREIAAVIAYIKSTWPAEIRARQARITAQQPKG